MEKIIGATCTIRWNDTSNDICEVYISFEDYNEDTEITDSGIPDDQVFYYANSLESLTVNPENTETDWSLLSIDSLNRVKGN